MVYAYPDCRAMFLADRDEFRESLFGKSMLFCEVPRVYSYLVCNLCRFDCDLRGDIYSLGATLYWALTKANLAKFKFNIPPLRQLKPDANHWLESVLAKCLQYAPERRYSSVDQVRDELINVRKELQGREGRAIDKTNALLERLYKQKYSSESL